MPDIFKSQLDYIFFIYGAAFLLLIPLCLFLRGRMDRKLAWAWLGWFGATHGLNEWLDLLALSLGSSLGFDLARLGLLAFSFVCLAEFGRSSLANMEGGAPGRWILAVMIGLTGLGGLAGLAGLFAATRYVMGLGGGLWAAAALFLGARRVSHGSRQILAAALGLTGYALATGLVTNAATFFPASWLNYNSFLEVTGFPIQLCRAVLAVWITGSLCLLVLASLDIDRDRRFRSWFGYLMLASTVGVTLLWLGGWFLTQYCGRLSKDDIRDDYEHNVRVIRQAIVEKMAETDRLVKFMTESPQFLSVLADKDQKNIEKLNSLLDRCSQAVQETICYVMDPKGLTIASSNRNRPDSFVGHSYGFRPYFQEAMRGSLGRYWAFGVTSKEMGYYSSCGLRDQAGKIIGVIVVKRVIDEIKNVFPDRSLGLILDPHGIVIMANHPDLVLRSLWPLSQQTQKELLASRQFGDSPFIPILEQKPVNGDECLFQGKRFLVLMQPGFWKEWSIIGLERMAPITQARLLGISATVVLFLLLIGFLTIAIIMRTSEEGFRQLFENAVDILILHEKGSIVAANQQACSSLGYTRQELLGMSLFDIEVGITKEELLSLWQKDAGLVNLAGAYRRKDGSVFPVEVRAGEIGYQGQNLRLAAVRDVTERKRAEAALRESEERLSLAVQAGRMFAFEWDPKTDEVVRSEECVDILGLGNDGNRDTGEGFFSKIHPEDRAAFVEGLHRLNPEDDRYITTYRVIRPADGQIITLEEAARGFFDPDGKLQRLYGMTMDITERQRAEEALLESERRFRDVAENAQEWVWEVDAEGKYTYASPIVEKLLGYKSEEILGKYYYDLFIPQDRENLKEIAFAVFADKQPFREFINRNLHKDGGIVILSTSGVPILDKTGNLLGYRGADIDITKRKNAEEALQQERQRLFNLLNEIQAFIFLGRPDYSLVYANKYFREHFGEPAGRHCYQILYGRREVCERCPAVKIFETGSPQEWEWTTKEGITYQIYGYSFADVDGSPLVLGMGIDITARKQAEMELQTRGEILRISQESYRHLAKQLMTVQERERQRLARELHDDLSQRLAVLAMEAEGIEQQLSRSSRIDSAKLKEIRTNLVKLSMDVHALSRRLHPSILDELGLADAIASECASFRQKNGIMVNYQSINLPPQVPKGIAINIYRIAQEALRNIARHAKATTVDLALLGQGDTILLTIKDNGQGFDPEGEKMAGLGLASMRERALLIGAEFAIHTQPKGGTVIEVTAPLTRSNG